MPLNKETKLAGYHDLNDPPKKEKSRFDMSKPWKELKKEAKDAYNDLVNTGHNVETDYYKNKPLAENTSGFWDNVQKIFNKQLDDNAVDLTKCVTPDPSTTPAVNRENFAYQYALSSWIFLDAKPPNTNVNYNKFVSILNYANKPNILYRAATNTLRVTVEYKNLKENTELEHEDMKIDEHNRRIVFEKKDVELQKWNHIVINNLGGTLDIFINGELLGTANHVVPYMTYDNLTSGTNKGIDGEICNVVYYKHPLNKDQIQLIYEHSKNKNPPSFPSVF
jgi:hypothetical protein